MHSVSVLFSALTYELLSYPPNILANSFNLISGFISIKFLQFTPHSGKLLLDNRILTFQPLIGSKHWRFLCNLWSIKLNLVILERSIHRMNVWISFSNESNSCCFIINLVSLSSSLSWQSCIKSSMHAFLFDILPIQHVLQPNLSPRF